MNGEPSTYRYFVDEAGDLTLFDRQGRIIVGNQGVSRVFIVGVARLSDPDSCQRALDALRASLLADPYFKDVPSMQPSAGKTALCFHARDDLPEVRREVFRLLPTFGARVHVALRREHDLALAARALYARSGRKLKADSVYDDLVARIFQNALHQTMENDITFARRGKSAREDALRAALAKAEARFTYGSVAHTQSPTTLRASYPSACAGLQIIDYYLRAVQRLFERHEDRFFRLLAADFEAIIDVDDCRRNADGECYNAANPLFLEKIKP